MQVEAILSTPRTRRLDDATNLPGVREHALDLYGHLPYIEPNAFMGYRMPQRAKTERLEARITSRQKRLLSDAADLFGETVTQFVLRAAEERANMILHDDNLFKLAEKDRVALIDALSSPPRPNKALRRGYRTYKEKFG